MTNVTGTSNIAAIFTLTDGNPGATRVVIELLTATSNLDPTSALSKIDVLLDLYTFGVRGSRLWMLYKDVCGESVHNTLVVLHARKTGIISQVAFDTAIDNYGRGLDLDDLVSRI